MSLNLGWSASITDTFDRDGEIEIWHEDKEAGIWLDRDKVKELIAHLQKVIKEDEEA